MDFERGTCGGSLAPLRGAVVIETFLPGVALVTLANPWLIPLHASGVTQNIRELPFAVPVLRVGNR